MENINKADFISGLADSLGISKRAAKEAVDGVINELSAHLANGNKVTFTGFGSFSVASREARMGRNPSTGAVAHIPASKAVKFSPGAVLKNAANTGKL